MKPYVVRPGDYLTRVAFMLHFDADEVWNDPKNSELKQKRDPNLLHPGDVLWVPDTAPTPLQIAAGSTNRYEAFVPTIKLKIVFADEAGPFANEKYTVDAPGMEPEGTTDGDGCASLSVPTHLHEFQLTFPERDVTYPVRIGEMDPIDETSGVRKRLRNLGYLHPMDASDEAQRAADLRDALRVFQRVQGLTVTGELDDATRDALTEAHKS